MSLKDCFGQVRANVRGEFALPAAVEDRLLKHASDKRRELNRSGKDPANDLKAEQAVVQGLLQATNEDITGLESEGAAVAPQAAGVPLPLELPKEYSGAFDHGVALIKQGLTDFAQWSAEMIKKFGEAIRDYLKDVWAAASKTSQSGAVQLGGTVQKAAEPASAGGQMGAVPASLPPGEHAPQPGEAVETRSFGARVAQDPRMNPKVQAQAEQEYVPIENVETLAQANAIIEQEGLEAAAAAVRDAGSALAPHVRVALGMQVMLRADAQARALRNAGDTAGAAALWQQVGDMGSVVDKLGTELGRGVQAFSMWARMTPEGVLTSFEKRIAESNNGTVPALPPELLTKLGGLRDQINALPEGSPLRADLMREMMNEMAHHEGIPISSIIGALWYANLLSGVTTQGMNVVGNGLGLMLRSLAAGLVNHPADTVRMLRGFLEGLPRAWSEARAALKGNVDSRNVQDTPTIGSHVKRNALEIALGKAPHDWKSWTAWVLSVGGLTRYVTRLMSGMDAAFYYTAAEGRAHLAASRAARQGHAIGSPEYLQAMSDMLGRGKVAWQAAMDDAKAQLRAAGKEVTKAEMVRIAHSMLDLKRPKEIREEAGRFGELVTSQQEPEGIGAWIYEGVRWFQKLPVVGRAMLPFARTLANLTSNALDFTPVGIVRGIKGSHVIDGNAKFATWERQERAAAGALGSAAMMYVMAKAFENEGEDDESVDFMIYGGGPQSKARRDQMPKGWKPFTIKIGRHYVSYAETPLVIALAPIGAIMDTRRYHKNLDERSQSDRFTYYAQSVLKAGMSQGVLSSMADMLGMVNGDVSISKLPSRITSGAIPGQGFLRDVTALFDPVKISDDSVAASILRDIPVARHWAGHPARDYMGDVITYEGLSRIPIIKRFITDQRSDDRDKAWVGQMRLSIPAFPKVVEAGDYLTEGEKLAAKAARIDAGFLTAAEQDTFIKRAGEMTRQAVQGRRLDYEEKKEQGLPMPTHEELQKFLNSRVSAARTVAMRELMGR